MKNLLASALLLGKLSHAIQLKIDANLDNEMEN